MKILKAYNIPPRMLLVPSKYSTKTPKQGLSHLTAKQPYKGYHT